MFRRSRAGGPRDVRRWADILEPQLLEQEPRRHEPLDGFLGLSGDIEHGFANPGDVLEEVLGLLPQFGIEVAGHHAVQICRKGAHVRRNGHLVVVQDDDQVLLEMTRLVQPSNARPADMDPSRSLQ